MTQTILSLLSPEQRELYGLNLLGQALRVDFLCAPGMTPRLCAVEPAVSDDVLKLIRRELEGFALEVEGTALLTFSLNGPRMTLDGVETRALQPLYDKLLSLATSLLGVLETTIRRLPTVESFIQGVVVPLDRVVSEMLASQDERLLQGDAVFRVRCGCVNCGQLYMALDTMAVSIFGQPSRWLRSEGEDDLVIIPVLHGVCEDTYRPVVEMIIALAGDRVVRERLDEVMDAHLGKRIDFVNRLSQARFGRSVISQPALSEHEESHGLDTDDTDDSLNPQQTDAKGITNDDLANLDVSGLLEDDGPELPVSGGDPQPHNDGDYMSLIGGRKSDSAKGNASLASQDQEATSGLRSLPSEPAVESVND